MQIRSLRENERGALHLIGIFITLLAGLALWIFMSWQDHLDRMRDDSRNLQHRVEILELKVRALEAKQ